MRPPEPQSKFIGYPPRLPVPPRAGRAETRAFRLVTATVGWSFARNSIEAYPSRNGGAD
jgi:hypothetical protein